MLGELDFFDNPNLGGFLPSGILYYIYCILIFESDFFHGFIIS